MTSPPIERGTEEEAELSRTQGRLERAIKAIDLGHKEELRLQAELSRVREERDAAVAERTAYFDLAAKHLTDLDEAREALERYGRHELECSMLATLRPHDLVCNCGFREALNHTGEGK